MDSLADLLQTSKIDGAVDLLTGKTLQCFLSDIFSPSRLYVQINEPEITKIMSDLKSFYSDTKNAETFQLKASQVKIGLKIALYACREWHRAEILSDVTNSGTIYVCMYDYGTTGFIELKRCKILLEEFNRIRKKAIRSCLYGVSPVNIKQRLFPLKATEFIVKSCYNKVHNVEFVTYHEEGNFYEIIARNEDGQSLNEQLILHNHARFYNPLSPKSFNIYYPSFDLLEKSPIYQCFTHRLIFRDKGIDFNDFEENNIDPDSPFEGQFKMLMKDYRFKNIRQIYDSITS